MHPMLNVAIQAIRKAGNFVAKQYSFLDRNNIHFSSDHVEILIANIHKESDRIITTIIKKFYPFHIIETYQTCIMSNKIYDNNIHWIINSIDNDTNFIKQFPFFALSIAVQYKKHIEIAVIYDPIHNELFSACRGKGAQFNGYRIRLHNYTYKKLHRTILAMSCSYIRYKKIDVLHILSKLHKQSTTVNLRQTGSSVLDLAYVAMGRVDGCFIISSKKIGKLASGILIIQESGGLITDFNGNSINDYRCSDNIMAGNAKIIKIILSLFKKYSIHDK